MRKIKNHIEELFKEIPKSKETELVKQEIIQNLEEKVMYLMENGKEEEDAINKAIVEFGDIEELKKELGVKQPEIDNRRIKLAKLNLKFALCGSALIIAFFIFINFYYTPKTIWFVYPTFGLLWWPLSMYFYVQRKK
ncbi:permease prefix domain 1-containing protein [Bacillus sp. EAC]|uniref:permease prefix domain 1-containing protein n=1 Tax=Bacillus sp. EAC TaxID=1978338 RepID=UPI000B449BE2|nr:permease prefix domain 1-containing protein [Bacillus sp. EAC]